MQFPEQGTYIRLGVLHSRGADAIIRWKNAAFYFRLVAGLLLSALLRFVIWLLERR
jgi:hypothetical protein